MKNSKLIINKSVSTNVSITFYNKDNSGKTSKFTRTISNIKETASYEDIYNAALSISKLYDYTKFDIKLISTTLMENDLDKPPIIVQPIKLEENKSKSERK